MVHEAQAGPPGRQHGPYGRLERPKAATRRKLKAELSKNGPGQKPEADRAAIGAIQPETEGVRAVDEQAGTVTHHREGDLRPDGEIDAVRRYEFVGDRLILRPVNRDQEIMWERIK